MAINSEGYTPNEANTKWMRRITGQHQGNNRRAIDHAERQVFASLNKSVSAYLILQNAFPCAKCHEFFIAESTRLNCAVIIKVTADEGSYSLDHTAYRDGKRPGFPHVIYYFRGKAKYVGVSSAGDDAPPDGFPEHPDFTDKD
jgi:hypothetical protein